MIVIAGGYSGNMWRMRIGGVAECPALKKYILGSFVLWLVGAGALLLTYDTPAFWPVGITFAVVFMVAGRRMIRWEDD